MARPGHSITALAQVATPVAYTLLNDASAWLRRRFHGTRDAPPPA